ncbi:CdaR family protein [Paenibacillus filicis]|uniref:CdaR family protein n=1 Tax=Paenibacillus gyeongsangnamensis TaxID=3388067 RepID=A0ABT4QG53_9BACL|nr:CdaR family protein [Paenibacillus filicis]MCZ8515840.1 CdaR family protein [Paenibacillus filicis]
MDQWLRNTNVVRVIALVIGILLWAVVRMDGGAISTSTSTGIKEEKIWNVPVSPKYDTDHFFVEQIDPAQVTVSISGRDATVKKVMSSANYSVELDLSQVGKGEHVLPLTPVGFPSGVTVKVSPSNVKVVVDEKTNKSMPVVVNVTGIPAVGLKAGQPVVKPKSVTVSVPSKIYDSVDSVRADVNVEKAQAAVTSKVKLVAYGKDGKPIDTAVINPAVVDVEVPITSPFTTVPLQLKFVGEPPRGFAVESIRQSTDKVTVYGPQTALDKMEFYEGPQVALNDLKEDKEFSLDVPLRGKVTQVDPPKVTVNVTVVPSVTKTLEAIPLSIIGQNDGFDTKVVLPESGQLNLVVEGAPSIIDKLKTQDVQAILDVSNLPPGKHEVPVTWNLPTFVKKGPQQDFKATVDISAKQGAGTGAGAGAGAQPPASQPPAAQTPGAKPGTP